MEAKRYQVDLVMMGIDEGSKRSRYIVGTPVWLFYLLVMCLTRTHSTALDNVVIMYSSCMLLVLAFPFGVVIDVDHSGGA